MLTFTVVACLCGLLLSNLWLLKEVDLLNRRLVVYRREVISLDERISRLDFEFGSRRYQLGFD